MKIQTEKSELDELKKTISIKWKSYTVEEANELKKEIEKLCETVRRICVFKSHKEQIEKDLNVKEN